MRATGEVPLEQLHAQVAAQLPLLGGLHLLRDDLTPRSGAAAHEIAQCCRGGRLQVDLHVVGQVQQVLAAALGGDVVQRDEMPLLPESRDPGDDVRVGRHVLQHLQDDLPGREGQRQVTDQERTRQVDEGQSVSDERLKAEVEEGGHQDLGRRTLALGHLSADGVARCRNSSS